MYEKSSNHQVVHLKIYTIFISQLFLNTDVQKEKRVPRVTVKAKGPAFFLSLRQRGESFPQNECSARRAPATCPHITYFSGHLEAGQGVGTWGYNMYNISCPPTRTNQSTGPRFGESHLPTLPEAGITILAYCSWQKERKKCAPPWSQHLVPQTHSVYGTRSPDFLGVTSVPWFWLWQQAWPRAEPAPWERCKLSRDQILRNPPLQTFFSWAKGLRP